MGFVRAENGRLVDGGGDPLLLRGVGLGNWLLPEGYMWKFEPPAPQSPREIEALILDLVGERRADEFWGEFLARYITRDDIAAIAAEGMNHVRLPINARVVQNDDGSLRPDGMALIDDLIGWCREFGLWVVLDLHGAPGGQTGTNIDDSPNGLPELFAGDHYRALTIGLWRALAERYRDEPVVAGYDLLNEPLPNKYQYEYAPELVALYKDLTAVIREVDPDHLIIYEGTHWASNWDIFTEVWDPNSMLQFHRYWSPPDRPGIQRYLDTARKLELPVYMGEGGENNPDWLHTAFRLYDDYEISWNFWPWKKISTLTSPYSIDPPDGWGEIVAYAGGAGAKPDPETAWATLSALLDAMDVGRCTYRADVMNALLRRAPLRIPATGFGFLPGSLSVAVPEPLAGFRSDDAATIWHAGEGEPFFGHTDGRPRAAVEEFAVVLDAGDWLDYEVTVPAAGRVSVTVSASAAVEVRLGGVHVEGGRTSAALAAGRHPIRVTATTRGTVLRWLEVTAASSAP